MRVEEDWESFVISHPELITYQLLIHLDKSSSVMVGRLGRFDFPAGKYIYTGSARRNLASRVSRHLLKNKTLRWHIDYLLATQGAHVVELAFSEQSECILNQQVSGDMGAREIVVPGFGATDCRSRCGSHLKYLGGNNLKTVYGNIEEYITRDGSGIRELMHPANDTDSRYGVRLQSLAEATVPTGLKTRLHRHHLSEELYHITRGKGLMTLGESKFRVEEGDTVCIPPGAAHCIKNIGKNELKILCCCSPAYSHDDTEILE